jgi:transcriptional/translational regulatory protein YebC/TACO1
MFLAEIQGFFHHFLTSLGIIPSERFVSPKGGRRPFVVLGAFPTPKTGRFSILSAEEQADLRKNAGEDEVLGEFFMSGHSKWAKIRRSKGATDQKRGTAFSKLAKEIQMAVKAGGPNPDANLRLKNILLKAKEISMPADTVKRAINKGTGAEDAATLEEITYEGYGPAGSAFLVEAVTDNRNRTGPELRSLFSKHGGNLAELGAVAFLFETPRPDLREKGRHRRGRTDGFGAGCGRRGFKNRQRGCLRGGDNHRQVPRGEGGPGRQEDAVGIGGTDHECPRPPCALDEKKAGQALTLYDALDENEDVQNVYANFEIAEEVMAKLGK